MNMKRARIIIALLMVLMMAVLTCCAQPETIRITIHYHCMTASVAKKTGIDRMQKEYNTCGAIDMVILGR